MGDITGHSVLELIWIRSHLKKERILIFWIAFQNKNLSQAFIKNNSKEEKIKEGLGLGKKNMSAIPKTKTQPFDRTAKSCCYNLGLGLFI